MRSFNGSLGLTYLGVWLIDLAVTKQRSHRIERQYRDEAITEKAEQQVKVRRRDVFDGQLSSTSPRMMRWCCLPLRCPCLSCHCTLR